MFDALDSDYLARARGNLDLILSDADRGSTINQLLKTLIDEELGSRALMTKADDDKSKAKK